MMGNNNIRLQYKLSIVLFRRVDARELVNFENASAHATLAALVSIISLARSGAS